MAHPEGELATANGAHKAKALYIYNTAYSTVGIEAIAKVSFF
jgi:isopentenyl diphosphate isomerase/L-lactate dehydrogenase-like FMN-dependent dehydrogenase